MTPAPVPRAVAPPGVAVSAQGGIGTRSRLRGAATVEARPLETLGFYASGLAAETDSSRGGAASLFRYRYAELGAVGAVPLAPEAQSGLYVTASVAVGAGALSSGGRRLGVCDWWSCSGEAYALEADLRRQAAGVGLRRAREGAAEIEAGLRIARVSLSEIQREPGVALDGRDRAVWSAEPYLLARVPFGYGTVDLAVVYAELLGDQPTDAGFTEPYGIYEAEAVTVSLGATLDFARVLGR